MYFSWPQVWSDFQKKQCFQPSRTEGLGNVASSCVVLQSGKWIVTGPSTGSVVAESDLCKVFEFVLFCFVSFFFALWEVMTFSEV